MAPARQDTDESKADEKFQFVPIEAPDKRNNATVRRHARSHAVRQGLEKKRSLQRESSSNFRFVTCKHDYERAKPRPKSKSTKTHEVIARIKYSPSAGVIDPFDSLAINSPKLQMLLSDYRARQAPEPVFSVDETLTFQSFQHVFRTGLVDPALVNAVMASLLFAVTEGKMDRECLAYQNQAIACIRERMARMDEATTESTIGSILLLAGVEARLGMTAQTELHMGAVQQLLDICRTRGIYLTVGIKRAIFWQDLNSSILTGSTRRFNHTTFAELHWARDPFSPSFYLVPPGFQNYKDSSLSAADFTRIIEDLHALQCIRRLSSLERKDPLAMAYINNHTASIQSRLASLRSDNPVVKCCRLACYICSVRLCCTPWCALFVPQHVSGQLLEQIQNCQSESSWAENPDMLLWLLYIGGAFAPPGTVRDGYVNLLRKHHGKRGWAETVQTLEAFIWSDSAFQDHASGLWHEVCETQRPLSTMQQSQRQSQQLIKQYCT